MGREAFVRILKATDGSVHILFATGDCYLCTAGLLHDLLSNPDVLFAKMTYGWVHTCRLFEPSEQTLEEVPVEDIAVAYKDGSFFCKDRALLRRLFEALEANEPAYPLLLLDNKQPFEDLPKIPLTFQQPKQSHKPLPPMDLTNVLSTPAPDLCVIEEPQPVQPEAAEEPQKLFV